MIAQRPSGFDVGRGEALQEGRPDGGVGKK
jgi:hypothetical protein